MGLSTANWLRNHCGVQSTTTLLTSTLLLRARRGQFGHTRSSTRCWMSSGSLLKEVLSVAAVASCIHLILDSKIVWAEYFSRRQIQCRAQEGVASRRHTTLRLSLGEWLLKHCPILILLI